MTVKFNIFLQFALVHAQGNFQIPQIPSIPVTYIQSFQNYSKILFWNSNCVFFVSNLLRYHQLIKQISGNLEKGIVMETKLNSVRKNHQCKGLVILGKDKKSVKRVIWKVIKKNWSFRVLALIYNDKKTSADETFLFESEINRWRSYDILLIEFGPHLFKVYQFLIHQESFTPSSLQTLNSNLRSNKFLSFNQRVMNISTFSCPLFVVFKRKDDDGRPINLREIDGIEFRMFKELARTLNFSWHLTVPTGRDKWGMPRFKGESPFGMIKLLMDRKIEIAICSWWLEHAKKAYVELSTYWNSACMTFLVLQPSPHYFQWSSFIRPFDQGVWFLLAGTTIFVSYVYGLDFDMRQFSFKPANRVSSLRSFFQIWYILLGGCAHKENGRKKMNRFLQTIWSIFALNICAAYCGSLAARLTLPEFEPMLQTHKDLSEKGFTYNAFYLSSWLGFLTRKYKLKLRIINNGSDIEDYARNAFFTKRVEKNFFMELENLPMDRLTELRASKNCVEQYFMTFAFPRGSDLGRLINPIIRRLVEAGITTYWLNRVFEIQYAVFPFERVYEYHPKISRETPLSLFFLQSAFLVWFVGNLAAISSFLIEVYAERWKKNYSNNCRYHPRGLSQKFRSLWISFEGEEKKKKCNLF